jgi:hypothetical protein
VCVSWPLVFVVYLFMLQISEQHIHGCQILDFVDREVICSVNDVKEPLKWLVLMYVLGICIHLRFVIICECVVLVQLTVQILNMSRSEYGHWPCCI